MGPEMKAVFNLFRGYELRLGVSENQGPVFVWA